MCMSCGCNKPNESHGDDRHIVMQDIQAAAEASNKSAEQVVDNIQKAFQQAGSSGEPATSGTGTSRQ